MKIPERVAPQTIACWTPRLAAGFHARGGGQLRAAVACSDFAEVHVTLDLQERSNLPDIYRHMHNVMHF